MTIGATRNTKRKTTSLERSIVLEPTKKIQIGLLAVALGFGSAAFTLGGTSNVFAQTSAVDTTVAVAGASSSAADYPTLVRSQELLLKARRSLMSRDVASAARFANEAQALNATYTSASDRPEYVFPLIEQYKKIEAAAKSQGMTEAVKRELAKNYLEQAEALRRCQDLDSAEALVSEARNLNVTFDVATVSRKMDVASVQARIADDRLASQTAAVNQTPLKGMSEAAKRQVAAIQAQLKEARSLVANGQAERAEAMVREIQRQGVPESAFAGGDSPEQYVKGRHKALTDAKSFYLVQERLDGNRDKEAPEVKKVPDETFFMRSFLRCPHCGNTVYGSFSKGRNKRYAYYHCNYCGHYRISAEDANDNMCRFLRSLKPSEAVMALYEAILVDLTREQEKVSKEERTKMKTDLASMDAKMKKLQDKWFEGVIDVGVIGQVVSEQPVIIFASVSQCDSGTCSYERNLILLCDNGDCLGHSRSKLSGKCNTSFFGDKSSCFGSSNSGVALCISLDQLDLSAVQVRKACVSCQKHVDVCVLLIDQVYDHLCCPGYLLTILSSGSGKRCQPADLDGISCIGSCGCHSGCECSDHCADHNDTDCLLQIHVYSSLCAHVFT